MRSLAVVVAMLLVAGAAASVRAAGPTPLPNQISGEMILARADATLPHMVPLDLNWKTSLNQDVNLPSYPGRTTVGPSEATQRNLPQELQAEPIPAPSAMSSGLMVLASLAGVRLYRYLKVA